jgi:hypothetical protein
LLYIAPDGLRCNCQLLRELLDRNRDLTPYGVENTALTRVQIHGAQSRSGDIVIKRKETNIYTVRFVAFCSFSEYL